MGSVAEEILSYYGFAKSMETFDDGNDSKALAHYGTKRHSGRYPWGSGEDPYQHDSMDFLGRVELLKKNGWTETAENVKKAFGEDVTLNDYRNEKAWCVYERRLHQVEKAKALKEKGLGATEIGREMGIRESTVRSLLNQDSEARMKAAANTADFLKKRVDEVGMIDVGVGAEKELNVSRTMLKTALYKLQGEGYEVYSGGVPQVNSPGQQTIQHVLCKPGTKYSEIYDYGKVGTIKDYISRDGGETFEKKFHYPESLDSKRLMIRYKDDVGPDGVKGIEKDGIVELRRGVADLSLGESRFSQVRIMVDGTHYIKGMAVYSDDMPKGVDVIFNTNKSKDIPMKDVLKKIKSDPDNPFGSLIKDADQGGQYWYTDKDGKKKLGLINKRADEGDWDEWANTLPSQFLSKQPIALAKKQLNLAKVDRQAEYDAICSLTNPTIKKHLLQKFSDECDSAAVHLKAAALPGQKYHVIIPINSLKDTEVYAPGYESGTKLALIRYPHGGTFEIPILTVNNKNAMAKKLIGTDVIDAVCINSKVAERLSGADFDGDTVMCIPTHDAKGKVRIKSTDPLKGLEGFDPKVSYGHDDVRTDADGTEHYYRNGHEYKIMKDTQKQMGVISNLITDMTLSGGATKEELARAVRHSMVVIDAEKHKLDYKASEIENDIDSLKRKYQVKVDSDGNVIGYGGAATLLSRAKSEVSVDKRQGSPKVNMKGKDWYDPSKPEGAYVYKEADDLYYPSRKYNKSTGEITLDTIDGKKVTYKVTDKDATDRYSPVKRVDDKTGNVTYTNKSGSIYYKVEKRTQPSTRMAETDDADTLVSGARHPMEIVYRDYANSMKAMANQARIEMMNTGKLTYDRKAAATYRPEVSSLMAKLNTAEMNATRERAAQRMANQAIATKKASYKEETGEDMKGADVRKAGAQALSKYRSEVGSVARRDRAIEITDREWEAIQAGAISESKLKRILNNADIDKLRERATPHSNGNSLTQAQKNRIKALNASNYTLAEIANKLGVSTSTVSKYLKGAN